MKKTPTQFPRPALVFRSIHRFLCIELIVAAFCTAADGQVPADFELRVITGEVIGETQSVYIEADRSARYVRYVFPYILVDSSFTVSEADRASLWQLVSEGHLVGASQEYITPGVFRGSFARVTVHANSEEHSVYVRNFRFGVIEELFTMLNALTPAGYLQTVRQPTYFSSNEDVCGARWDKQAGPITKTLGGRTATTGMYTQKTAATAGHPGTAVSERISLTDAVARGIVNLEGKGGYFGDAVSASIDNSEFDLADDITIDIYVEFYGDAATVDNAFDIAEHIEAFYDGHSTSDGREVDVRVDVRVVEGTDEPPRTPGYHQIELVEENQCAGDSACVPVSHVQWPEDGGVNEGTASGEWRTTGEDLADLYEHEAGHLIGLPDEYTEAQQQSDGSWVATQDGEEIWWGSTEDLASALQPSYDPMSIEELVDTLNDPALTRLTVPLEGEENNVMAGSGGDEVPQRYFDALAAAAGIIVEIRPGDILIQRDGDDQHLVVTRSLDLFVPAGESKTFYGVYTACFDGSGIPSEGEGFDVAPPLGAWEGVSSASVLQQLLEYIDREERFCYDYFDRVPQNAIWRLTYNENLTDPEILAMMQDADISIGDARTDFREACSNDGNPCLSSPAIGDTGSTRIVVPPELIVASVEPKSVLTSVGERVTMIAALASAAFTQEYAANFSWSLETPLSSQAMLQRDDGSENTLILDTRGIYHIHLNTSVISPEADTIQVPKRMARIVAGDEMTDTFERSQLSGSGFRWSTSEHATWKTSSDYSHTGSYSARSGQLAPGDTSWLSIRLFLPVSDEISFALRIAAERYPSGRSEVTFAVDNSDIESWTGEMNWRAYSFPLPAGEHEVKWYMVRTSSSYPEVIDRVWIDDVVFPQNAVITSIASNVTDTPNSFSLSRNYPNPFNPSTVFSYDLPTPSETKLTVFDVLGRQVSILASGMHPAGTHEVTFDATGLPPGVYFCRLQAGDYVETRSAVLIR